MLCNLYFLTIAFELAWLDQENFVSWLLCPFVFNVFTDQELVGNSEPSKRQRRWNSETIKVPEPQTTNLTPLSTPKDSFQYTPRRAFTRSDSTVSGDSPKERIGRCLWIWCINSQMFTKIL